MCSRFLPLVPTRPFASPRFSSPHSPGRASSSQARAWNRGGAQPKAEQTDERVKECVHGSRTCEQRATVKNEKIFLILK